MNVAQEELRDPLVLLVAAGRAPGEVWLAIAQCHGRRQRRAWPFARRKRSGMAFLQPEHLGAAAEAEAELRNDWRGLQPSARWRRGHHVAGLVDDVEMHGVAANLAEAPHRRLAGTERADGLALALGAAQLDLAAKAFDRAGEEIERSLVGDELAPLVIVGIRQQRPDQDLGELGIAIEFLAVGEGKLGAFDLEMDELRPGRIEPVERKALEQRELLERDGALAPDAGLADGVAAIVVSERRLDRRLPARHVVGREHAAMRRAADVHHLLRPAELVDGLRDEALRPGFARAFDLGVAASAAALGFAEDAGVGCCQRLVDEERSGFRHLTVRKIHRGRGRPMLTEQLLDGLDRGAGAFDQRIAVAGVGDRGLQHVAHVHRAVVSQQHHPGFESAGNAGREQAGAGHHVEAFASVMCDGGARGRRALTADHLSAAAPHIVDDDGYVAAGTVQMRFDHLEREGGGDAGIEGIPALFQDGHADGGRNPVRGGDDAERAFDLGPRREWIGIDLACHRLPYLRRAQLITGPRCRQMRRLHGTRASRRDRCGVDGVAGDAVDQFRGLLAAEIERERTAWIEGAAGGGLIGFGISPLTGMRWRPLMARSGTAPSSILV